MTCCRKGTNECTVKINGHLNEKGKPIYADKCIVDIVQALNDGGLSTVASCCGHQTGEGSIYLRDGRKLRINRLDILRDKE